jgi:hypothetical protein
MKDKTEKKTLKEKLKETLDHMARENQKEFGSGKMDCCSNNRRLNSHGKQ